MDVFLVPVAPDRYELYCEEPDEPAPPADAAGTRSKGIIRRFVDGFREQLAEAERARRHEPHPGDVRPSFFGRVKARLLRWVAESIAEQRLLWQLRGKDAQRLANDPLPPIPGHCIAHDRSHAQAHVGAWPPPAL